MSKPTDPPMMGSETGRDEAGGGMLVEEAERLESHVAARLAELGPREVEIWVVCCSGGPDSLALLVTTARWARSWESRVYLLAVYVDHGLRPEAPSEGRFVANIAETLGICARTVRVAVAERARRDRCSLMEAARLERLEALAAVADEVGATRILLGHTADDQAETVLMRLDRGTGIRGLGGMDHVRGKFVRPLLAVRRVAIEEYLKRQGLTPVRDPSNEDRRFLRVRIRHDVLPALREQYPSVDRDLVALAEAARRAAAALERAAEAEMPGQEGFLVSRLRELPSALRRRVLERAFQAVGGQGLCASHVHVVERLLGSTCGTQWVDLPAGIRAVRAYDRLRFEKRPCVREPPRPLAIEGPGTYEFGGWSWTFEVVASPAANPEGREPWVAVFDAETLPFPLLLRCFQPGDRIRPRGFGRTRKVSDLLGEARVPAPMRRLFPLLVAGASVVYVPGIRVSSYGCPHEATSRVLVVSAQRGSQTEARG